MDLFDAESEPEEDHDRPVDCGVMCFHAGTEEALLLSVASAVGNKGNPNAVLAAVDNFCETKHWMMCCGPEKSTLIRAGVRMALSRITGRPLRACELGTYIGYSAIVLACELGADGCVLTLESERHVCLWARRMVDMAGLSQVIEVCESDASEVAHQVAKRGWESIDILFIDHDKQHYLRDVVAAEPVLTSGSVVIADNITCFDGGKSMRDYLAYVRQQGPYVKSVFRHTSVEYSRGALEDGVEISVHA